MICLIHTLGKKRCGTIPPDLIPLDAVVVATRRQARPPAEPFPLMPRLIFRRSAELCPRVRRLDIRQPEKPFLGEELTWSATNKCRYPNDGMVGLVRWSRRWTRRQPVKSSVGARRLLARKRGMRCFRTCRGQPKVIRRTDYVTPSAFRMRLPSIRRQSAAAVGCDARCRAILPLRA